MAFIGEAALSAFFEALFTKLFNSFEFGFVVDRKQVRNEIEKWAKNLGDFREVLADAEEKQGRVDVKNWLADLQDLAYDVDDILDEFATEALGRKLMKQHQANTSKAPKFNLTSLHPSSIKFNYKTMSKIKEITEKLEDLANRKSSLPLKGISNDDGRPVTISRRPPSTSLVNKADVRGRDNDQRAILDLLLRNDGVDARVYSVIPIVGLGGIGKTTLTQLVFNDNSIEDHFDIRAWVCVSHEFDIFEITKIILRSVTSEPCEENNLNLLQVKLKEKLFRKKFLLVLDDVWNENYGVWEQLQSPFHVGAPGSKIIVTTRSSKVSLTMTKIKPHTLQCLSTEESLCMLARHALEKEDFTEHPDLEGIGLEIVKKCDGLPLAIKTIAGLLRTVNPNAWKDILECDIWNLPQSKSDIIPALWLSYYYLPSPLKQCFAYCSLLPKDYEFSEEEIVLLWMAEGFLNGVNTKKKTEDLGSKYFEELVSRSFFQASSKHKSQFVMHDLINDLAQFVGGEKYSKRERYEEVKYPSHTRHASYVVGQYDEIKRFETFFDAKSLRTFLPFNIGWQEFSLRNNILSDLLLRLKCLRVLSLKRYKFFEIPHFIGNLRHLRYLDFSRTMIKGLPDSVCTLYNLETLLLNLCEEIEKLPLKMGMLENLCHLDIAGTNSLKEMSNGIGNLTNLRTLSKFIVGQGDALNIKELQNLSNLQGQLSISQLQNVNEAQYAWEANLSSKPELDDLELQWSIDFNESLRQKEVEAEVLKLLQPHEGLKALSINYYAGLAFPLWMENPSLKNLQSLKFEGCRNCIALPAVGKLPLLKDLHIKGMSSVTGVGNEFYGENWPNVFPSLETLHFEDMPEWEWWKACEGDEQGAKFHCLRELLILNCPNLMGTLPEYLPSLEKLVILGCQKLVVSISTLTVLRKLEIKGCEEIVLGSSIDLWAVKKIILSDILKFTCATKETMMLESMKVEDINVNGCEELVSLWQTAWGWLVPLKSLRNLELENCSQVVSIGARKEEEKAEVLQLDIPSNIERLRLEDCEGFQKFSVTSKNLMCLAKLKIVKCPKLVSLLADNLPSTLKILMIGNCENMLCLLEDGENINFRRTSTLESLQITECKALKSLSSSRKLPVGLKSLMIWDCPQLESVALDIGDNNCLEFLEIVKCKALKSLSLSRKLPVGLKSVMIWDCPQLESVAEDIGDNNCLEIIRIGFCENMQYLPQGLDKLRSRQRIVVSNCPNMVCFPESVLPNTNLKCLDLSGCGKLQALPIYSSQLQELRIQDCPRLTSIPEGGFPTNLTNLFLREPNVTKAVTEWGLHRFTSLKVLSIDGGKYTEVVSFPQGMNIKLPPSLNVITITNFENLRKLSFKGFQHLSSLQSLSIICCPRLKSLPKRETLPTLLQLSICDCPVLKKKCKRHKGKSWSKIAHIPKVLIDHTRLML